MTIHGYFVISETYVIGITCQQVHKKRVFLELLSQRSVDFFTEIRIPLER